MTKAETIATLRELISGVPLLNPRYVEAIRAAIKELENDNL